MKNNFCSKCGSRLRKSEKDLEGAIEEWLNFMDQFSDPSEVGNEDIIDAWNMIRKKYNINDLSIFEALGEVVEDPFEYIEGTGLEEKLQETN